ncbi:MAG: PqqD family protein [Reyranellaceae bacterium]
MTQFKRNAAVTATEIDDGIFLVEPESQDIYFLDAVSSGLWRLLETPASLGEMQAVVREAFPDQPAETLDADVAVALDDMLARRLVFAAA